MTHARLSPANAPGGVKRGKNFHSRAAYGSPIARSAAPCCRYGSPRTKSFSTSMALTLRSCISAASPSRPCSRERCSSCALRLPRWCARRSEAPTWRLFAKRRRNGRTGFYFRLYALHFARRKIAIKMRNITKTGTTAAIQHLLLSLPFRTSRPNYRRTIGRLGRDCLSNSVPLLDESSQDLENADQVEPRSWTDTLATYQLREAQS